MNTPVPSPKRYLVSSKEKNRIFKKRTSPASSRMEPFTHLSSELYIYGIDSPTHIDRAIERTLKILLNTRSDTQNHLQNMWMGGDGGIERLWEMSETAYRLTLINLAQHSSVLSQMLIKHLKHFK